MRTKVLTGNLLNHAIPYVCGKIIMGIFHICKTKKLTVTFFKSMVQKPVARVHNHYPIDIDIIN